MKKNDDLKLEAHGISDKNTADKKFYKSPELHEWGSILELTGGGLAEITDADFNGGSSGV